ncbi:hypothetical protein VP1G_10979 [Cytospora mali]|uniref:Uncharacterized protein n=1 Tax=Cytospora mali TaxID=578113 RepID=A0A194V1L0_CYTMA|nr:hypothetical protein VP1G_10979 [Valsa mali var. pyri (nom. inval.)]
MPEGHRVTTLVAPGPIANRAWPFLSTRGLFRASNWRSTGTGTTNTSTSTDNALPPVLIPRECLPAVRPGSRVTHQERRRVTIDPRLLQRHDQAGVDEPQTFLLVLVDGALPAPQYLLRRVSSGTTEQLVVDDARPVGGGGLAPAVTAGTAGTVFITGSALADGAQGDVVDGAHEQGDDEQGGEEGELQDEVAGHGDLEDDEAEDHAVADDAPRAAGSVLRLVHGVEELVFVGEVSQREVDDAHGQDDVPPRQDAVHQTQDEDQQGGGEVEAVAEDGRGDGAEFEEAEGEEPQPLQHDEVEVEDVEVLDLPG